MKYIALTGPMYSGKTTLAMALQERGYLKIGFADQLKQYACEALEAVGVYATVRQMNENKQVYRAFLQSLGTLVDFDTDPAHIENAIAPWVERGRPKAVFDNVRFNQQANTLHGYGFKLVQIRVGLSVQYDRAAALGVTSEALEIMMRHSCEQGVSNPYISIDGTRSVEENVELLINL